jgi:NitT/TauT family transport system ATP-binding protein
MKQRVGIIRALANDPEVLLMDEPLGALDAQTRVVLQEELLRIWEETRKTVVYITHSLDEAVLLGDRVILMSAHPGRHLATFTIDLPRPRGIAAMNTLRFAEYRAEIWDKLSAEVNRAMELQQ